jgi:uncharacterized protein (DUF486 family)
MLTILLLLISNIFMTLAWYGQLRFPNWTIATAIIVGWSIALLEYCFAVPANRIGYAHGFIQETITLAVFAVFAVVVLKEPIGWRYVGAYACIMGAAAFMFCRTRLTRRIAGPGSASKMPLTLSGRYRRRKARSPSNLAAYHFIHSSCLGNAV